MIKSFKIRLYPTREQEQIMWKHIGACRYIWNWMIAKQQDLYTAGERHLSAFDMGGLLKPLKNDGEHEWLCAVSNASLIVVCRDLHESYQAFFKKQCGHPKFKSRKRSKPIFPVRYESVYFSGGTVHIEKVGKVKFKSDFEFPQQEKCFMNPRISYVNNKWLLSVAMECENQAVPLTDIPMGIDLGVKETMTVAYGDEKLVFHNINKSKQVRDLKKKIVRAQRSIARKYETNKRGKKFIKTNNIIRAEERLRKLYRRLNGIRHNYMHQATHTLIALLPCQVVMEDLNVSGMMKNRHLSQAIQEQCFYEILRQMKYKCEWSGMPLIQVGRFFPSSKLCSNCGCIKSDLKLKDRTYVCDCGLEIDRDYNAAINLMRYEG